MHIRRLRGGLAHEGRQEQQRKATPTLVRSLLPSRCCIPLPDLRSSGHIERLRFALGRGGFAPAWEGRFGRSEPCDNLDSMTSVGHCLTGLSLAALVVPRSWVRREKVAAFAAITLVANAPDLPLPFWGHYSYRVSHSVFVNLALVVVVASLLLNLRARRGEAAWRWVVAGGAAAWRWVVAGGAAAWLSHMMLDSFYSQGRGIRIFWAVSDAALSLSLPWFHVLQRGSPPDLATLRIFATEAVFYGALLAACLYWRRHRPRRFSSGHPA